MEKVFCKNFLPEEKEEKFLMPQAWREPATAADYKAQRISLVLLPALPLDHRSGHGRTAQICSTVRECVPVTCAERGHVTHVQLSRKPV